MASRRKQFQENIRFQVIKLVSENPEISTRQIAKKIGISNGFVKFENFWSNPNKSNYIYILTPKGLKEKYDLTFSFLELKKREYIELQEEIRKLEEETKFLNETKKISRV